ncbi:MAG: SCO family protein [Pseudomonadota bacterium]|nr:SCO family protein [Pseudomonadota bacterium]
MVAGGVATLSLAGCDSSARWHETDITGSLPPLAFTMTDATDGKAVTAADFRDHVVMLYFGYTMCPDFCPTTLANLAKAVHELGPQADRVRILLVTVDPNRDTLGGLKRYTALFAPQVVGLRGTADQLTELARRYRVAYSVKPASAGHPYEVTHSSVVYVFDATGRARLLVSSMATSTPDVSGTAADLKRLLRQSAPPTLLQRIERIV